MPDQVINQIAAGEVIERPAAAVKELLENSLDAGATQVEVEFTGGGKTYIRIEDNGQGMTPEEALLALERHATSKLRRADDLLTLRTLGFRGEALPSVASISRFTLRTRTRQADYGTELLVDAGKLIHSRQCALAYGTRIEVAHLFAPVPARRKFLKSDATEGAHITQLVRLHALARPDVSFHLIENGRTVFRSAACPTMRDRVAEIWGAQLASELIELPAAPPTGNYGLRLRGLVGKPGHGRATRRDMIWLLNGRPIENRMLDGAVIEAAQGFVPRGRYPLAFLFLEIDPAAVDVNIHPSKKQVRFGSDGVVKHYVWKTVSQALEAAVHSSFGDTGTAAGFNSDAVDSDTDDCVDTEFATDASSASDASAMASGGELHEASPEARIARRRSDGAPAAGGSAFVAGSFGAAQSGGVPSPAFTPATGLGKGGSPLAAGKAATPSARSGDAGAGENGGQSASGVSAQPVQSEHPAHPSQRSQAQALPAQNLPAPHVAPRPASSVPSPSVTPVPAPIPAPELKPEQAGAGSVTAAASVSVSLSGKDGSVAVPAQQPQGDASADFAAASRLSDTERSVGGAAGSAGASDCTAAAASASDTEPDDSADRPAWQYLARLHKEYALMQAPAGLVVLRLRAAHERVWFERIRNYFSDEDRSSQQLLLPLSIEFDPLAAAAMHEHLGFFNAHGFEVEAFGRNFYRIHAHPGWLATERVEPFVRECVELARRGDLRAKGQKIAHDSLAKLAATRAVRLGDQLSPAEIEALAAALLRCENPLVCPSGKPTLVEWSLSELGRRFGIR